MKINLQLAELRIDNPCHEDWDKMNTVERGKFCNSCKKIVHDFTQKSKEEIIEFFRLRKFESACVRVKDEVLNKPSVVLPFTNDSRLRKQRARFAYALYLIFGSLLFSCNTYNQKIVEPQTEIELNKIQLAEINVPEEKNAFQEFEFISPSITTGDVRTVLKENFNSTTDTIELPDIIINSLSASHCTSVTTGSIICVSYIDEAINLDSLKLNDGAGASTERINSVPEEPSLKVFPNPSQGEFQIQYKTILEGSMQIDVINIYGQLIQQIIAVPNQSTGEFRESVNLNDVAAKIYLVRMQTGEKAMVQQVIIQP
ncbi:MAG: T9SS type A sorting domain-containing protein [Chitinophagales bacterium]|nr:T9SS type A sorting domain-containing protein [Chitinophagales bacterium]